ncbi:hypothetical protein PS1_0179 [Aeromonas phage PS1]|uniref:Uncharacterized protein n=1 Tax=Aeromonas phage PS1 TaxID=2591406 RepID=A0A514TUN1_9CAUD|nr:hypothetical protein PQC64_gp084 [Aeromonas phage PS1]QDJ96690.1 hypothetical protein PS1_0179 [Aeromonas phage PS1]
MKDIVIFHLLADIDKSKILYYTGERRLGDVAEIHPVVNLGKLTHEETRALGLIPEPTVTLVNHIPTCDVSIINQVCRTVDSFFKDKAFEGCRTPAPFRNDKAIYKQHKRQRKHK